MMQTVTLLTKSELCVDFRNTFESKISQPTTKVTLLNSYTRTSIQFQNVDFSRIMSM